MLADSKARKILKSFPKDVRDYFKKIDKNCQKHGILLKIHGGKALNSGGRCGGYFSSEEKVLAVAIGIKNIGKILALITHESFHVKQWANPRSVWHEKGVQSGHARFCRYLAGERIYRPKDCAISAIRLERDCEHRTIRALKKWQKYVNINTAKKRANAYVLSHWWMLEHKKWPVNTPYDSKILKHCPNRLLGDYRKIPQKLKAAFDRYL
jgi:hypothetical protein